VIWGIWYAPAFLLVDRDLTRSTLESAGFVLTCTLLGALLGWLRLVSKSVAPTTISNGVLTLTAGLPACGAPSTVLRDGFRLCSRSCS
jgi:hypothetical protein